MTSRSQGLVLIGFAVPFLGAGCGAGVAGVVASTKDSSGGTTPTLTGFEVVNPKVSPATLRLEAAAGVLVELSYKRPGGLEVSMAALTGPGVGGNRVRLAAGTTDLTWNFAVEFGGTAFIEDVSLFVHHPNGTLIGGGSLTLGMGNDPPAIEGTFPPLVESDGVVPIGVRVSDSSSDVISVAVEWRRTDEPDAWRPASAPEVLPGEDPNPLQDVQVSPDGTFLVFFWDTDRDLADDESDVQVRFTPDDGTRDAQGNPIGAGEPMESGLFRVDNNEEPIVQFDSGPLIVNPDERRGIPIPFRVIDEEEDSVEVIFQWRRSAEEFPSLDRDGDGAVGSAELGAILADPELRREHHVCTPYPRYARGCVLPIDQNSVRLPELASRESWILASGLEGKTLELLRPSSIPAPISPTWRTNPLVSPVAAVAIADGLSALVLDAPGGNGRLREIELGTGEIVQEIARLAGAPTAMVMERGSEDAVIVASDLGGAWRIDRIELASGTVSALFLSDGSHESPPVWALESLGTRALLLTAGSSLMQLDYRDSSAALGVLRDGLASPRGVVRDLLATNRIYLAERDHARAGGTGRVLALELDTHGQLPVVVKTRGMEVSGLEHPTALALNRAGSRLIAVTNDPATGSRLVGLDLGAKGDNVAFLLGSRQASEIASIRSGLDGLLVAAIPDANELLVGGGIEQRRAIVTYAIFDPVRPSGQVATVDEAFDPEPRPGQAWRIPSESRLRARAGGVQGAFVWDSEVDLPGGGRVFLRALARDAEPGVEADGTAAKSVQPALVGEVLALGDTATTGFPNSLAAADLDGDGDLDLASTSADSSASHLAVFFQESAGVFETSPLIVGGVGTTNTPLFLVACDLDGNGDLDLVSANLHGDNLTVFLQESPGVFATFPLTVGPSAPMNGPRSLAAADLDGDGDLDLASANEISNNLTVFYQESPGVFASSPLRLGGAATTIGPWSIAAADFDGDGDLDLASANADGDNLTIFFQRSSGAFASPPLTLGGPTTTEGAVSLAAADLDEDGDLDLASANWGLSGTNNGVTIFFQESLKVFATSPLTLRGPAGFGPIHVAASDLDGDGDLDLASANNNGNNLTVFFQESRAFLSTSLVTLGGSVTTDSPLSVAAADLDGDGDMDLAATHGEQGGAQRDGLTVFFQESAGSFRTSPLVLRDSSVATGGPLSVASSDVDGDGDLDLASANFLGQDLMVFFQESPGVFATPALRLGGPGTTNLPQSVAASDLDGDGDLDLASANSGGDNLTVFFQEAPRRFASGPLTLGDSTTTGGPSFLAASDLDGDGDLDLASANFNTNALTVFFQESQGRFATAPLTLGGPATTRGPLSLVTSDLDGDGDLDLASANSGGDNLTVFFQESPGAFVSPPLTLGGPRTTEEPLSLAAADLDWDGDLDLASANFDGDNLTIFFQESPGVFATPPRILGGFPTTSGPRSLATADVDGDGDLDVASANRLLPSFNLTIFFQESPGVFGTTPLTLGGPGITTTVRSVVASDLDGDGDADLVSANIGGTFAIFWGGR